MTNEELRLRRLRELRLTLIILCTGAVLLIGLCLLYFALADRFPFLSFRCVMSRVLHLYCPGCGGTRAVKALLRGNIMVSALYHPFVIYCAAVALVFAVSYVIYWKTKKPAGCRTMVSMWIFFPMIMPRRIRSSGKN